MIEEYKGSPKEASLPAGVGYEYFAVLSTTVPREAISSAEIEFKISKAWVDSENVLENTICMLRWDNEQWNTLETHFLSEDNDYLYFKAISPELSLFAAIAQPKPAPALPVAPPPIPWVLIALAVIAVSGIVGAYAYLRITRRQRMLRRLERAVLRPPRRRIGRPVKPVVPRAEPSEIEALKRLKRIAKAKQKQLKKKRSRK